MKFYQRIEVWVLLLLAAATALFVLKPAADSGWEDPQPAAGGAMGTESVLGLKAATLERDFGNARLDLDARVTNPGRHPLLLTPPQTRLLAGSPPASREVPPFFLPAERPPEIAPGSTSEVQLRYWLEGADLQGPLWLDVNGERLQVKSAAPFGLEKLENQKPVKLRGIDW